MVRWLSLAAFLILLGLAWLTFELTNAWPFNQQSIPALRAVFAFLVLAAVGLFLFSRWRLLPAASMLIAFAAAAVLSNAVATVAYLALAGAIVVLVAVVSRTFGPPLNVR